MSRWIRCALPLLVATLSFTPVLAADPPDPNVHAATSTGAVGIRESVRTLMLRQAVLNAEGIRFVQDEEEETEAQPDRTRLPQNPLSPDVPQLPAPGARSLEGAGETLTSAQSVGLNFTGAALAGPYYTSSIPPDPMGAVGPTQYVLFVNGRIVSFNRTTGVPDGVLNVNPNVFFGPVRNGTRESDPRIRYDRLTGRWFLVNINVSYPNRILIAVSDEASNGILTTSTVFTFFYIDIATTPPAISSSCLADYPTLGLDRHALYVGTNNFCTSYSGSDGYVIRKSSILGSGPIVVTVFRGLVPSAMGSGPFTPQGVDNFSTTSSEGYFIGTDNASFGTLMLRRVSDPGGTPTISSNIAITVPATKNPLFVDHLGNTGGAGGRLSPLDDRLFGAVIRNGRLWTAQHIGVNNNGGTSGSATRNGSRWYEIAVPAGSGTPSLVQSGTVYAPSATNSTDQRSYFYPTVMVSGQGHAAMALTTAGLNEHANAAVAGRLASDALGTMQAPTLVTNSTTAYNPAGDPGGTYGRRWGDYSYVCVDPLDDMTMWSVHMWCSTTDQYGVQVTQLLAPPPATPASIADVTAGQSSATVTLTGTSVAGSGFFDPGADPPGGVPGYRHLTAAITAAGASGTPPAVISATMLSATTVQLVLDASAATPSASGEHYTVTVTNPDGQSASAAILRVVPGSTPSLAVNDPSVAEGASGTRSLRFDVTLTSASGSPVSVDYAVTDGTAEAGSDYTATSGSLTIPAGNTSGSVTVPVIGDPCGEASETLTLHLANASGGVIADSVATGTITNDDDTVAPSAAVVSPNGGETLTTGTSADLQWSATDNGTVSGVDLLLSRDGGATWPETLASGIANSGSFTWTVTGPGTATARLRVVAHDDACNTVADASNASFAIQDAATAVEGAGVTEFALGAIRPNPSRGAVQLDYQLPREADVRLTILDLQGREVAVLAKGRLAAGRYSARWSGRIANAPAPRGAYFARFEAAGRTWSKRFFVVR